MVPFPSSDLVRMNAYLSDVLALVLSAGLMVGYVVFLRVKLRRNPLYTIHAVSRKARTAWVAHIMQSEARAILAVQTLRNSTMVATFLASTAVLLMVGTLNLVGQADHLSSVWHALNIFGPAAPVLWVVKVLLLLADFFVAFFSFAMSVRFFNHVGYHIALGEANASSGVTVASVATMLNRAGGYYTFGMRAYYVAVPLVFWLFGPHFLLLASMVLVFVLLHVDRAPRAEQPENL